MTMYKTLFTLLMAMLIGLMAVSGTPTAGESTCLTQCGQNYTYPAQPSQPCCGCCSNGDTCQGNGVEFRTCCRANEDFCGCISSRAYCGGSVYNASYPVESPFGTCFPKGYGSCTYNPGPNNWVVCPTGLTGCVSEAGGVQSCCQANEVCGINGLCTPAAATSTPATTSYNDCGCVIATDQCCHDVQTGKRCYNPSSYSCTTNDQGQQVLCSAGSSSCGVACYNPSQYCCQNGNLHPAGSCSAGTPTTANPTTATTAKTATTATPTSNTGTATPSTGADDCGCVIATDHCCHDLRTGKRCFNPQEYSCTNNGQGQDVLCPNGYSSCGTGCYNPSQYCCQSGALRQPGQCSGGQPTTATTANPTTANPTTATSRTAATTTQSAPGTCNGQAYDSTQYSCATNDQGNKVLCPVGNSACGSACYNPSQYCCQDGGLRQAGQCTTAPPTSTGSSGTCNGASFNSATQYCCSPVNGYGNSQVCSLGQHCCGSILNGTEYYGPGSLYTGCYNPSTQKCCYGGTSAFLNPSMIEPNTYSPSQGSVQQCIA